MPGNVRALDPGPAMFGAMLRGWEQQQQSRLLARKTIGDRLSLVRRFALFTATYQWEWTPEDVEAYFSHQLSLDPPLAHSTVRGQQGDLQMFCAFVTDGRYGWAKACEDAFGQFPVQVCHGWNTADHVAEFEGRPGLAAAFLTAMRERGLALADVTQHEIDAWLASGPGTHYEVRDFVVWAARRGHSRDRLVPHRPKADPEGLDEDSHWELLQQCLTDTALPLEVRTAGAVLLLFGQHVTRIAALPADALATVDGHTVLILDRTPIRLPEPLALLLTKLTRQEPPGGWAANSPRRWLFPGTRPGRHLSSTVLARRLTAHRIPVRPARTTALIQLAQDLPPAILAPMLGLHVITAQQWRRRAATDWTAYLEARRGEPVGRQATR
ncbi:MULTISPECIES: hypothetical protein [unclassified Streptomyces]|uniref:hypothetical protein n=1 Tax=unclassified Streptomyces TaxID=2593676 RepID=UPI0018E29977|nr:MULTISPECIES: hypothetical protein [unclassified Streptomyces]